MLLPERQQLFAAISGGATTAAQTLTQKIVMQPRRLAGVRLLLSVPVTTAPTTGHSGVAGLVKEIRLRVNDGISGMRNAVQIKGPALLSFLRQCGVRLDRNTIAGFQYDPAGTALGLATVPTTYKMSFYIPCVDPRLGERAVPVMSIPLNRLSEDAQVEVDLGVATTDIGASCVTSAPTLYVQAVYREGGNNTVYIPSELITATKTWSASQKDTYEFAQTGFLTGVMLSNFTSAPVRAAAISAGGSYTLKYGTDDRIQTNDDLLIAENDMDSVSYPANPLTGGSQLAYRNMPNEVFFDLLKDSTTGEAFNISSALDLRVRTMLGEKCSVIFDQAVANAITWFTTHRLLPFTDADLNALQALV